MPKNERLEEKMDTVLGAGSEIEGTISVRGGMRIDGKFKGNLNVQGTLVVGKSGSLDGEIHAKEAVIGGTLKGKVRIDEKIEFQTGATFEGELVCKGLIVQEGVKFDGTCSMSKREVIHPVPEKKE
ncbi:MAG: polymer-forming cytoskeletal protein [Candidatus Hydrothermae bacterium]|nr:polymer-forming cytoskeletal protein [Candidatus Hydrothermae bacterium]